MWRNKRRAVAPAGATGTKIDTQQKNGDDRRRKILVDFTHHSSPTEARKDSLDQNSP